MGYVTQWTYDALGRVVTETPPNGGTMTSTYDALGRRTAVSDAYNNVTTTAYDLLGRTVSVTDPIGNATTYEYADFDQPTLVTLADGSEIATTYNKRGMTLEVDLPNSDERVYTYDVLGRTKTEDNIDGDTTTYVYDNLNRVTSTTYPNGLAIAQEYDPAGRLTKRTKSGTGIDPAETEQWTYDANGNQTTFTDADGKVWSSTYDALNRLSATETPNSTPAAPARHTRVYDAAGRLTQRTDAKGQTIGQVYNADGQLVELDYPDGARVTYAWTCCRLKAMQDQFGLSTFTYDLGNRVLTALDPFGHLLRSQYDANGRLAQLSLPGGGAPLLYDYSPLNQISQITDTNADVTAFTYGTETGGQLTQIGLPSGADLNTTWDTNGVIATGAVAQTAGGTITETYTPADTAWPVASPLKASVTWGGNAYATSLLTVRDDMRVTAENYTKAGALQYAQGYTTSPANNLVSIEDLVAFPDITTTNQFFDAASFLRGRVAEEYSAIDNAQAIALATNPNNIVTDLNGNIIAIELPTSPGATTLHRWAFSYDYENRLTKIVYTDGLDATDSQSWDFGYDGLGRRVFTQIDGANAERLIYTGDQLVQSRSALDDSLNMEYTYGPTAVGGSAIYKQWDGTTKEWFYTSPQDGFPRFKLNNSGVITQIYQYSSKGDYVAGFSPVADAPAFGWMGKWVFGLDTPFPLLTGSAFWSPNLGKSMDMLHGVSLLGGGTCPTGGCRGGLQEQRYEGGGDSFGQTPDPVDVGGKPSHRPGGYRDEGGQYYYRWVGGLFYWNYSVYYAAELCPMGRQLSAPLGIGSLKGAVIGSATNRFMQGASADWQDFSLPIEEFDQLNLDYINIKIDPKTIDVLKFYLPDIALCFCRCPPQACLVAGYLARQIQNQARLITNTPTSGNCHNNPCDAVKHCMMSCAYSRNFIMNAPSVFPNHLGCTPTLILGHEALHPDSSFSNDLWNNHKGGVCAYKFWSTCANCCEAAWRNGKLRW